MDFLAGYNEYLISNKKSSGNTLDAYVRDVKQFITYCGSYEKVICSDNEMLICYLQSLQKSESTKARIIASLRSFYKYLKLSGVVEVDPTNQLHIKKPKNASLAVLDEKEIILLLSQPKGENFKSLRDKAMLELLYATGIKVSELLAVKLSDLNLTIGILHLKNGIKERIVPIYPQAVLSLSNYIQNARQAIVCDDSVEYLFTNLNGQPMSRQGFWKIIKHYAKQAGIKQEITPQTLRNSFAAHLLENGAKLRDIKEMLGHSDISSTQVYAQFVKNKYASKYAKFHPLAK